jgi:hypothetical protein
MNPIGDPACGSAHIPRPVMKSTENAMGTKPNILMVDFLSFGK